MGRGRGMDVGKRRGGRAGSFGSWFPREQSLSQERGLRRRDRANSSELLMSSAPYALSSGRCTPSLTLLLRPLSWLRDCNPSVKFPKTPRPSPHLFQLILSHVRWRFHACGWELHRAWFIFLLYAFGAGVAGEGFCVVSVFDGLGWTAVDAGHAVGAVFSPDRGSVFQMDVV